MRLIDADALLDYLDKRKTYELADGRNKAYGKGVRDAMKDVEQQPIIDAIPVEWLKRKLEEVEWQAEPHFAYLYVLHEWQDTKSIEELQAESEMRDYEAEQKELER